ncbi:MAG: hypothetical protein R2755_23510 [Acidimicrobiales bacterium]
MVTALCGFSRISAGEPEDLSNVARLEDKGVPTWVPVVGEPRRGHLRAAR